MDKELIIVMLFGLVLFLMMLSTIVMFVLYYQKKRQHHAAEISIIESTFEQESLKAGLAIQEQTFASIGSEIHDNIGQLLSLAKMRLGALASSHGDAQELNEVSDLIALSLGDLRDLSRSLHPSRISKQPLYDSILHEVRHLKKLGIAVEGPNESVTDDIPEQTRIIVFRVVQELLNNIVKHARASNVKWDIAIADGKVKIVVADDGVGMATDAKAGLGQITTDERMQLLGGSIERTSSEGRGVHVVLTIPLLHQIH